MTDEIILSPSQQKVIDTFPGFLMNEEREMSISGFAGSGKSFLVKYLADMGEKQQKLVKYIDPRIPHRKLIFSATTNKAARVLQDMLKNRETTTIHRVLGLKVKNNYSNGKTYIEQKVERPNLQNTIIFIDEASMINNQLLDIIRNTIQKVKDCKVIYIGDKYQLPPVFEEASAIFDHPNTQHLEEIQRQVADSPIIKLSAKYRECLDTVGNWPTIETTQNTIIHYKDKNDFFKAIAKRYTQTNYHSDDYRVLAWTNKRVRDFNTWIKKLKGITEPFTVGEHVITNKPIFWGRQIQASTDSQHVIRSVEPTRVDGVNGYYITLELMDDAFKFFQPKNWDDADKLTKTFAADKDWTNFYAIKEGWLDLRPVHACTVHKSQGSTYKETFIDLNDISKNTKWNEVCRMVYVAITRASNKVHLYGELKGDYQVKRPVTNLMENFDASVLKL